MPLNVEEAIFIEPAKVSRFEPAILQDFARSFGFVEIALENVWALQPEDSQGMR